MDDIGGAIADGRIPPGHVDTVEGFERRTGASRSIVREATRVLVAIGMLRASRRVGLQVLPASEWDMLDPQVVRWRLAGPERMAVLRELRGLRAAIEPEAAAAAADRVALGACPPDALEALHTAADRLTTAAGTVAPFADRATGGTPSAAPSAASSAGPAAAPTAFVDADRDLHAQVLHLSGNAMFFRLHRVVEAALEDRANVPPAQHDVALHRRLVDAVLAGDADRARSTMREIVART
ncbi:FadR/GntR family transcriptional regulator [Curtobacterium ammoniigenes]|uniref:FadR/GntR family transcriptional regulator n=1 Tax=Curtobacterium ammoniigenes TaxID=395387 RepID=UPI000AEB8282|nr:FCD domain-containing protein [Curtobacterium ammoniigenes]